MANVAWNLPQGMEAGLEASSFYDPPNFTYPFGAHVAVVEVDPETGHVQLQALRRGRRLRAADQPGDRRRAGARRRRAGHRPGALGRGGVRRATASSLTGSLADYAIPRADVLPDIEVLSTVTPSPHHPLGVKGIGEAGTIASTARSTTP